MTDDRHGKIEGHVRRCGYCDHGQHGPLFRCVTYPAEVLAEIDEAEEAFDRSIDDPDSGMDPLARAVMAALRGRAPGVPR